MVSFADNLFRLKIVKKQELSIEMQFLLVFPDARNIAELQCNNADISRTQGVCHMTLIFLGFTLSKV